MRRTIFLGTIILLAGMSEPAAALNNYPAYIEKYRKEYHSPANRENHKIRYGYSPYYFSNAARSRYSYSAFEKGHYRYGTPDRPWPFSKRKFRLQKNHSDPSRVLTSTNISKSQRKLNRYIEKRMQEAKRQPLEPRVNDSRDLDSVIRQHKWEYQSKEMRDALRRDPNNVRADPTDYKLLFQDN